MIPEKKTEPSVMRKNWFDFVKKTRVKMARRTKEKVSHRDAMKEASTNWAAEKAKLLKRIAREARKKARESKPSTI